MHAVGADLHRDLHTVVDDEGDAVAGGEGLEFLCLREKGSLVKLLFAKLQKGCSGGEHPLHLRDKGTAVEPAAVGDGIEPHRFIRYLQFAILL